MEGKEQLDLTRHLGVCLCTSLGSHVCVGTGASEDRVVLVCREMSEKSTTAPSLLRQGENWLQEATPRLIF